MTDHPCQSNNLTSSSSSTLTTTTTTNQCENNETNGQQQQHCCQSTNNNNNCNDNEINSKHHHTIKMSCSQKNNNNENSDDQSDHSITTSTTTTTSSSSTSSSTKNTTLSISGIDVKSDPSDDKKSLKSLLKKKIDPTQDFIKSHNKRVKFSETMQVFCYEMPDQMPQIIALKPDANLMEFQSFMYDPPAEYQDLLTFEPPPDYRDFIANSLNVFRNEVTFDFIDDDDDSENDSKENIRNPEISSRNKFNHHHHQFDQNQNSKWQSMILNNNLDSLEEEQIIGVLKEDDILQAIGSQVTLPDSNNGLRPTLNDNGDENEFDTVNNYEENLSSADFPVHHLNSYFLDSSGNINEEDDEVCCIDSSPNGSLQDLASDSSITSQDTIILINQNKTFQLETVKQIPPNDNSNENNENIYENLQPCHREINVITQMVNCGASPTNSTATTNNNSSFSSSDSQDSAKEQNNNNNNNNNEALYENTGELLSNKNTNDNLLVTNQVKNFENRLSTSSSEDSKNSDNEFSNCTTNNNNNVTNNNNNQTGINGTTTENRQQNFKQNILFYEKIMEQQQQQQNLSNYNNNNNKNKTFNPNEIANSVTVNMQVNAPQSMTAGNNKFIGLTNGGGGGGVPILHQQQHAVISSNNNLMPLPCYTILETNRTSSSSSLSSASSSTSSSLVPPTVSCPAVQQNSQTLPLLISTSANIQQIKSQISPNSNSPVSSSSSSSTNNLMNHEQFGTVPKNSNSPTNLSSTNVQQIHISIPDNNKNSNSTIFSPNEPNSNMNAAYLNISGHHVNHGNNVSPRMATSQQHICIVNNPGTTTLRPGQVIYRYPYALIQPGINGVSTIRPVQYIVQAAPTASNNTNGGTNNSASIIYNQKLLVSNQLGSYTISPLHPPPPSNVSGSSPSGSSSTTSSSSSSASSMATNSSSLPNNNANQTINVMPKPTTATTIIQQAQIVVPNSSIDNSQTNTVPVRRIIVPQGTTLLAPRIMQLHHPQHKQHPIPPYHCYVQQKHPTVMAYAAPPNVQIRQTIRTQQFVSGDNIQQNHHTQFPDPSEIRRRDGLYAYPQVLIRKDDTNSNNQCKTNENSDQSGEEKDELEAFVQQEHQRTERIKKRYSFTEDEDPTFGFARRPSVRGIRPKFGQSNEIIQQMNVKKQSALNMTSNNVTIRQVTNHPIYVEKTGTIASCSTLPKNLQQHPQFMQINQSNNQSQHPHMISIVKKIDDMHVTPNNNNNKNNILNSQQPNIAQVQIKSQTLPRQMSQTQKIAIHTGGTPDGTQHEIVRIIDASMLNGPAAVAFSRDQLKLHLQKTMERQQQQQQQQQQSNSLHQAKLIAQHVQIASNHQQQPRAQSTQQQQQQQNHDEPKRVPLQQQQQHKQAAFSPNHPISNNNNITNNQNTINNSNESQMLLSTKKQHQDSTANNKIINLVNSSENKSNTDVVYYSLNV